MQGNNVDRDLYFFFLLLSMNLLHLILQRGDFSQGSLHKSSSVLLLVFQSLLAVPQRVQEAGLVSMPLEPLLVQFLLCLDFGCVQDFCSAQDRGGFDVLPLAVGLFQVVFNLDRCSPNSAGLHLSVHTHLSLLPLLRS